VALTSRLESGAGGAPVHHRLGQLSVEAGALSYALDLPSSDRSIVRQAAPAAVDAAAGRLVLDAHRFTVDYGRFARDAFAALGLGPAGLAGRAGTLGAALYETVDDGAGTGCAAFSRVVCGEAGRLPGCLGAACGAAAGALNLLLDRWWRSLDGDDLDFGLSGAASVADPDADLVIDALADGQWTAEVVLAPTGTATLTGSWSGQAFVLQ
jgi:hypothetical protein